MSSDQVNDNMVKMRELRSKMKINMNKIIAVIGILSSIILTGCDPELKYFNEDLSQLTLVRFNEDDNMKMIGFNTIESNDNITVIVNFKKNNK